jgi:hypothetical protein
MQSGCHIGHKSTEFGHRVHSFQRSGTISELAGKQENTRSVHVHLCAINLRKELFTIFFSLHLQVTHLQKNPRFLPPQHNFHFNQLNSQQLSAEMEPELWRKERFTFRWFTTPLSTTSIIAVVLIEFATEKWTLYFRMLQPAQVLRLMGIRRRMFAQSLDAVGMSKVLLRLRQRSTELWL